jgi:hypothetical protein
VRRALFATLLAGCSARLHTGAAPGADGAVDGAAPVPDAVADIGVLALDASSDSMSGDAIAMLTGSQFVTAYDMVSCNAAFACKATYPGTATQFATYFGSSTADCYQLAQSYDLPVVIDADVASGEIHFDPIKGAACLAGLAYDCATYWQQGLTNQTTCSMAMVGTIADGGVCHVDWDCAWTSGCTAQHQCAPY